MNTGNSCDMQNGRPLMLRRQVDAEKTHLSHAYQNKVRMRHLQEAEGQMR